MILVCFQFLSNFSVHFVFVEVNTKITYVKNVKSGKLKSIVVWTILKSNSKMIETEAISTPLAHINMAVTLLLVGTDTSVNCGKVTLVLWTQN